MLLCQGNRLLTGSNSRWLRLWEVEALQAVKPQENACNVNQRSGAFSLKILSFSLVIFLGRNLFVTDKLTMSGP